MKKKCVDYGKIVMLVGIYFVLIILLTMNIRIEFQGVILELQVMIAVYLTVCKLPFGYVIANVLLVISLLNSSLAFFSGSLPAGSGIIICGGSLIICCIINKYSNQLKRQFQEAQWRNKQLSKYNDQMKVHEQALHQLAYYDTLTELPNREKLIMQLEATIERAEEEGFPFAVVFIDLDNFKMINDTMGHQMGDEVLKRITHKIRRYIYKDDILGRLGGDEFALIIRKKMMNEEIMEYIEGLRVLLLVPLRIEEMELKVSASFGVSIYPKDGKNASELLRYSDIAMYQVKYDGKNNIRFFEHQMNHNVIKKVEMETHLVQALEQQELFLQYQPQYELETKCLHGFEALVRWDSERFGMLGPNRFIPVAEEIGFIIPMGEWILRTACSTLKDLQETGQEAIKMSVNFSVVQIMDPFFIEKVKRIIEETGIDTKGLEFELTESVCISSLDYVISVMKQVKELGITIALDDFGTGYSSLNYLQMLPIDILKIDKTFIDKIQDQDEKKQMVGAIIELMHHLDLQVVAEGVEGKAQLEYLKKYHCDIIQGYYWGKPLSYQETMELARKEHRK